MTDRPLKAIQTHYKGCRFRSRLEARWAVFFDALGIGWEYEPQGFEIGGEPRWRYLPDFFLPKTQTWVEVKGSLEGLSDDYFDMILWALDWGGALPGAADSCGTSRGLLWLGPIPSWDVCRAGAPSHAILQHQKGVWLSRGTFFVEVMPGVGPDFTALDRDVHYFDASVPDGDRLKRALSVEVYDSAPAWAGQNGFCERPLFEAYTAARSARFEHGETP